MHQINEYIHNIDYSCISTQICKCVKRLNSKLNRIKRMGKRIVDWIDPGKYWWYPAMGYILDLIHSSSYRWCVCVTCSAHRNFLLVLHQEVLNHLWSLHNGKRRRHFSVLFGSEKAENRFVFHFSVRWLGTFWSTCAGVSFSSPLWTCDVLGWVNVESSLSSWVPDELGCLCMERHTAWLYHLCPRDSEIKLAPSVQEGSAKTDRNRSISLRSPASILWSNKTWNQQQLLQREEF